MFTLSQFANSKRLPSLPEVALRLVEVANQEDPDFDEIGRIIRSDPVIAGKILKTVNSALFGLRNKVESVEHALPQLGVTLIRTLILSFHLAQHRTNQERLEPVFQRHWRSSLTQAVFAELIGEQIPELDPSNCFLAGMLQDIGILAMISEAPDLYLNEVMDRRQFPNVASAERSCFGFAHVDVSAEIVRTWGLGDNLIEAIAHHHDQVSAIDTRNTERLRSTLQAASMGTAVLNSSPTSAIPLNSALLGWIEYLEFHLGFSDCQAEMMINEVNQRVQEYSVIFNFNIGERLKADVVVSRAKEILQEIALKNQLELLEMSASSKKRNQNDDAIYRDCLSGLFNRRFMSEELDQRVEHCIKKRKPIGMMFLDVDRFKAINDSYGHATGDLAIQHVAKWLGCSIRNDDVAIRIGGDEFLVVLQKMSETEFNGIAHRISNDVPPFQTPEGESINLTLSVGGMFYQPVRGDIANANWLIDQADQLMYQAKKSGGNTTKVQVFLGTSPAAEHVSVR